MGKVVNCCEVFLFQETSAGFCYSFNSCTAFRNKDTECHPVMGSADDGGLMVKVYRSLEAELLSDQPNSRGVMVCTLRHTKF